MSGVTVDIGLEGMDDVMRRMAGLTGFDLERVGSDIGALLESSTKERLYTGKAAPDGTPWAAWSEGYASTRKARHSLLIGEGDLADSVQSYAAAGEVVVGSNLVYAAVHQLGSEDGATPERAYLGLSDEDARDIRELVLDDIEGGLA